MIPGAKPQIRIRDQLKPEDPQAVRDITQATGFFRPDEVDVAVELVDERLKRGEASGYYFVFADAPEGTVGYACYGPIACTVSSFDLYWLAVHPTLQGRGVGRLLVREAERRMSSMGGTRAYIETSAKEAYASTRAFHEAMGYRTEAILEDFYAPGDGKVILSRKLP